MQSGEEKCSLGTRSFPNFAEMALIPSFLKQQKELLLCPSEEPKAQRGKATCPGHTALSEFPAHYLVPPLQVESLLYIAGAP